MVRLPKCSDQSDEYDRQSKLDSAQASDVHSCFPQMIPIETVAVKSDHVVLHALAAVPCRLTQVGKKSLSPSQSQMIYDMQNAK